MNDCAVQRLLKVAKLFYTLVVRWVANSINSTRRIQETKKGERGSRGKNQRSLFSQRELKHKNTFLHFKASARLSVFLAGRAECFKFPYPHITRREFITTTASENISRTFCRSDSQMSWHGRKEVLFPFALSLCLSLSLSPPLSPSLSLSLFHSLSRSLSRLSHPETNRCCLPTSKWLDRARVNVFLLTLSLP